MAMTTQMVGKLANDIITSLKVETKQDVMKAPTANAEAYEYYLKGQQKYEKRENTDDTEIARGLYQKAIELDDNLILAKVRLGRTYYGTGDYDKAMEIFTPTLKQAEELGDKRGIGNRLNSIGILYVDKGDFGRALDYLERSLAIAEELGDKFGIRGSLNSIGTVHSNKGDLDTALDYYERSLAIVEELGHKRGMGRSLLSIGHMHWNKGGYEKALEYLEKSLAIQKEIGLKELELATTTILYLTYKHLGKDYDEKEIHSLIKEAENIEFEPNYAIYQLLEDKSYLESAFNQIQEKTDNLEDGAKFLSYPIPAAIVEEWEKVK